MSQAVMVLDREFDTEIPVVLIAEPERSRYTVPLLAAGWGAFFTFSIAFMLDDGKLDASSMAGESAALLEVASGPARTEAPRIPALTAETVRPADTVVADLPATDEGHSGSVYENPPVRLSTLDPAQPAMAQRPASLAPEKPSFVGTWGPNARACGARANRRGYIPATISETGAKAGRTQCRFRNGRREGASYTAMAECSDGTERWTSQVKLVVHGDKLNWTSEKGPAVYVRCGRREG